MNSTWTWPRPSDRPGKPYVTDDLKTTNRRRGSRGALLLLIAILALLALVMGRCWYLQYYCSQDARDQAARQQLKIIPQRARRGMIVDRRGVKLALSVERWSVALDPSFLDDVDQVVDALAAKLSLDPAPLARNIQAAGDRRFLWIKRFVRDDQADSLRQMNLRGVIFVTEYERRYPLGPLAAHVIGFTDIDGRGREGVEAQCDTHLAGKDGTRYLRTDTQGRAIGVAQPPEQCQDGLTVVLSLDVNIQAFVAEQLAATVQKFQATGALAVAMNPRTGEVLALANYPTFDPNSARLVGSQIRRNRVLTDPVEPGSIFKPFTVAAALQGGYVTPNEKMFCHEGRYAGRGFGVITEYGDHAYGDISVTDIVVHSSNIGAAKIAQKMGKKYFHEMIERFGFGRKTDIDLPGEGPGILRALSEWKWGDYALTRAAYGQGPIVATPIQLIRAFCCFANAGKLVRPSVIKGVLVEDELLLAEKRSAEDSDRNAQIIAPEVAAALAGEILRAAVDRKEGTAHNAYIDGVAVFGKTGTAQVAKKDGKGYEDRKYISSFIAGAPADDPRICTLVMVQEPNQALGLGYTGGMVAAPAVREIIRQTLTYWQE